MANKRINELALRTPQTTDLMLIGDPTTGYSYKTTLLSALNLGVPTTRTLTINGTTFDLSANRSWSVGTVTSVGLTMPAAFNVASSPVTGSGTIAVTAAGLASQYIRGDGTLADFPGGGGSGGASVSYYLNGSVNQGTIGGVTYYEMNKTPILGAGTNFTTSSNGYIASFLTDAGDPALLKIPGGNWNTEFYFAASSGGGTPTYYLELYKYDGTTFTLIASNSSNPDAITGGTSVEQYFTTLAVPETILTATDRLAIRIYVNTAGRTITLHTENSKLCQIITTFTTGLTALNGLTAQVQYFATGSSGTDFNISSSTSTHTFNIPTASSVNRGLLSSTDWSTFNNKVPYTGATANVDLNTQTLSAGLVYVEGQGGNGGQIGFKQYVGSSLVGLSGYNTISSITKNTFVFSLHQSGTDYKRVQLQFTNVPLSSVAVPSLELPSTSGTLALTSNITSAINGTTNWIPRFTSANAIGLSNIFDNNTFVGVFTATDNLSGAKLQVNGAATFSSDVTSAGTLYLSVNNSYLRVRNAANTGYIATIGVNTSNKVQIDPDNNGSVFGGNVGLGVTPSAWVGYTGFQIGTQGSIGAISTVINLGQNVYYGASGNSYIANGKAAMYQMNDGEHNWRIAGTGTANNAITFTQAMTLDASGNLLIGQLSAAGKLTIGQTAGNSAIAFVDTTNSKTNFINVNNGQFQFWVHGPTQAMTLDASGRLGIGTATPQRQLHIHNTTGAASIAQFTNADSGSGSEDGLLVGITGSEEGAIILKENLPLWFATNDTERLRITSSGNVGIGTATPTQYSGFTTLNINNATNGGVIDLLNNGTRIGSFFNTSSDLNIGSIANVPFLFYSNNSERMRLTSSGRILIGTTTDNTVDLLQVAGSARFKSSINYNSISIDNNSTTGGGGAYFLQNGTTGGGIGVSGWYLGDTSNDLFLVSETSRNIRFATNGANERMRITSGGNIGIGTNTPTDSIIGAGTFLDIASTGGGALKLHYTNATAYGEFSFYKGSNGSYIDSAGAATAANNDLIFRTGGTNSSYSVTERMRINAAGGIEMKNSLKLTDFTTSGTAGSIVNYVQITVGTTNYLLPLYNLP